MKYFIYCRKSQEAEDRQVLSLESQLTTLQRAFKDRSDIEIVDIYQEALTAKVPGRPRFNEMLARIEKGDAQGIIAWAPDRLARNSLDDGHIMQLLDRGTLKDLKFGTSTFENNSQGKFMLNIMFSQAQYYSDALSDNVKRGNRTKIDNGWRPNQAPIGYRNDIATKTIVPDPDHFPVVRRIFEAMLTGTTSVARITHIANDVWGYRTPQRKRMGGGPLRVSTAHHMLTNPFYAGLIIWNGQAHPGKHDPVVSLTEFDRVQELLGRPRLAKPKRCDFAYTGVIRCGACNHAVTAEHKTNRRYGVHYVYYHCTRPQRPKCPQPSIEVRSLEAQIRDHLAALTIPDAVHDWASRQLTVGAESARRDNRSAAKSLQRSIEQTTSQLSTLTDLRLRGLLTDAEFADKRMVLQQTLYRLEQNRASAQTNGNPIEPQQLLLLFSNRAVFWFDRGDTAARRLILNIALSNLFLKDKKLTIQAKKPFASIADMHKNTRLLADLDDVRTSSTGRRLLRQLNSTIASVSVDPALATALDNIRSLMVRFNVKLPRAFEPASPPLQDTASRRE